MSSDHTDVTRDVFVINKKNSDHIDTIVFTAGPDGGQEAVAVFTSRIAAADYIEAAGWAEDDEPVELSPVDLLSWLVELNRENMQYLAVDPAPPEQEDEEMNQPVYSIDDLLEGLAGTLVEWLEEPAEGESTEHVEYDLYRCQKCGSMERREVGETAPTCCEEPMALAGKDAEDRPVS